MTDVMSNLRQFDRDICERFIDADYETAVCGGRLYKRRFNKKDFPILGSDQDDPNPIYLSSGSKNRIPKALSTSVADIHNLCRDPKTGKWRRPTNGADLVYPGIYLGDATTALCVSKLLEMGVTAVVNVAQGSMSDWSYVNTKASYYSGKGIKFLGIPAIDLKHYPLNLHFKEATEFIHDVISNNGKVLVHCVEGISRSASIVIAYLILKKRFTIQKAIETIREKRFIAPNEGFVEQLVELNDTLHGLGQASNGGRRI